MNIEELNKTQIILLTLLISFVTSIATGIVTVSLVNQAPPVVTDTIHKVIEKTVERIVPGEQKATIIEKTTTVVVNNENSVADAVEKNSGSLVRIFNLSNLLDLSEKEKGSEQESEQPVFIGLGAVLSKNGAIVADNNILDNANEYFIYHNNTWIELEPEEFESAAGAVFLKTREPDNLENLSFQPIDEGNSDNLKLGQSIIALGGEKSNIVLTGIISNLTRDKIPTEAKKESEGNKNEDKDSEPKYKIITTKIDTNLDAELLMNLLINLDGEVIGIKLNSDFYTPINLIKQELNQLKQARAEIAEAESEI